MLNSKGKNVAFSFPRRQIPILPLRPPRALLVAVVPLLFLAACSKPLPKAEEVRPVRTMVAAVDQAPLLAEFPGEVRARYESRLGFRVAGKIVARQVEVGSRVRRGQRLMQLDPQDLQLAQAQAGAGLAAAQGNRDLAQADLKRYRELRAQNFVSQALLEAKETSYMTAQASYRQALAAYQNQAHQTGYATLVSDVDGVITGIDAEAGQVVAAGTPVVRVAQPSQREIVIGVPEDQVAALRQMDDIRVRLWADPRQVMAGKIREVSPLADPTTRTYTVKIALPQASDAVQLGMSGYVAFVANTHDRMVKVPLTALLHAGERSAVWVIEDGVVRLVPVQVAGSSGNDILLASGLAPGQVVVTAGAHLLKAGQKVKVLGDGTPAPVLAPKTPPAGSFNGVDR